MAWLPPIDATFAALDFELADAPPDSACAVGLARVERGRLVHVERRLIRPPRPQFGHSLLRAIRELNDDLLQVSMCLLLSSCTSTSPWRTM